MRIFRDSDGNILGHTGTIKDFNLETDFREKLQIENKRLFSVLEKYRRMYVFMILIVILFLQIRL